MQACGSSVQFVEAQSQCVEARLHLDSFLCLLLPASCFACEPELVQEIDR